MSDTVAAVPAAPVEVVGVAPAPVDAVRLRGRSLEAPRAGELQAAQRVRIGGWVLGRTAEAVAVEVLHETTVVARAELDVERLDVAQAFPDVPDAAASGFALELNLAAVEGPLRLHVRAVLADHDRAALGTLELRRLRPGARDRAVTVVIPCFNQAHFLGDAIESVLRQTASDVRVVVVDDGSTDNAVEVVARHPGVRYVRQDNAGLPAARNTGLALVETPYVVFLDADDRLVPAAIERGLAQLAAAPDAAFAAGRWRLIGEDGGELPFTPPPLPEDPYEELLRGCFIGVPASAIYRRSIFDAVGGFDTTNAGSADYELYLRIARQAPVRLHGDLVAEYRRHGSNMTRDAALILRSERAVLRAQRAYAKGPERRAALREGLRRSRDYHGRRLVDDVRRRRRLDGRSSAVAAAWRVARLHPRGVGAALRAALGRDA